MKISNLTTPNSAPLLGDTVEFYIGAKRFERVWSVELSFELYDLIDEADYDTLSRVEFRELFTLMEQVAIDNYFDSALSVEQKQIIRTSLKSMEVAETINLKSPKVIMFVQFLANTDIGSISACGILTQERADQILARGYA